MKVLRVLSLLLVALACTGAQARDNVLRLPVAAALADPAVQAIVGTLPLRFGAGTAANADIAVHDVQIDAEATAVHDNVYRGRTPSDESVCQLAFADAMKRLVAEARKSNAAAVVGIVSDYRGQVADLPDSIECHAGTFHSYVSLRAQLARSRPLALAAPPTTGFAELADLSAVPLSSAGRDRYAHFLTLPKPRAFFVLEDGSWRFWADDPEALDKGFEDCARQGKRCWLYAVDDGVVWNADESRRIGSLAQWRGLARSPAPRDEHQ